MSSLLAKFRCDLISEVEVIKIITSFENKYSTGSDDVLISVIKQASTFLAKSLVHIINSSFITGIFPDKLKITKLKPLYKKGNSIEMSNYRPLALLPVLSKIYERAMYNRLIKYLETNSLFDKEQHGFRPGHSVITAAIDYLDSVITSIDVGEKVFIWT